MFMRTLSECIEQAALESQIRREHQERRAPCVAVNVDNEPATQAASRQTGASAMSWSVSASTPTQRRRETQEANAVAERNAARRASGKWNLTGNVTPDRAPDDRRRRAAMAGFIDDANILKTEWSGDLDLREEFPDFESYRAFRLAETRGQIQRGRSKAGAA